VRVLADAGALAQGRPVVEKDAQAAGWYHSRPAGRGSGGLPQPLNLQ
jgi:hypothetical protein